MKGENMPVYKLEPTSEDSADWQVSEYKGPVIVRAQNEDSARLKVQIEFGPFNKIEERGNDTLVPLWQNDNLVICKQLDNSEYEEEGPEEILFPKSNKL